MIRYGNPKRGAIRLVEIVDRPESIQVTVQCGNATALAPAQEKLHALGFTTLSQTIVRGQPALIATGPRVEPELIKALSTIDRPLPLRTTSKPFDAWKVRSIFGFSGQLLQLASSVMKNKVDGPLLLFASTNLAANTINLVYKGQKRDDPHQMELLKTDINAMIRPSLPEQSKLPDIHDNRSLLREHIRDNAPHPVHHFMQRYSVNVGELGLRYIGAMGMAYPASDWKAALAERRMPMTNKAAPLRTFSGLGSMFGKAVASTSLVPDPYNPTPRSTLDDLRAKYSFLAGGLIEAGAFSALTYDALVNSKPEMRNGVMDNSRSLKIGNRYHRDWLSALGGALFVSGYIARSWAKYGERRVDMHEVYSHASDALAILPREDVPQMLANVSAYLSDHFQGKADPTFGEIYNKISDDLCREHHITIIPPVKAKQVLAQKAQPTEAEHVQPSPTVHTQGAEHAPLQAPTTHKMAI